KCNLLGAACEECQAGERVQERPVRRNNEFVVLAIRVGGGNLPGCYDAIGRPDGVEALGLGAACSFHECVWSCSPTGDGKKDSEFHVVTPLSRMIWHDHEYIYSYSW